EALFGVNGRLLHERCRGNDTAPVTEREIPLSISRETSFHRDTADRGEIEGMLEYLVGRACRTTRELAIRLLRRLFTRRVALHAVGVRLTNFCRAGGEQGSLFDEREAGRRAQL